MPIFRWIYPKIMGKGQFFGALRAHKMLILLNFAQKSLSCNPPPPPAFGRIFTHAYTHAQTPRKGHFLVVSDFC